MGHWEEHRGQHGTGPPDSSGGRQVITGAPGGGRHLNENTGGEEARGGERDARASKVTEDMEIGRGNLGWRKRAGGTAINIPTYLTINIGQSLESE